jgi:RNA polymerase sigma-70 factor (ECF subfamily)
MSGEELIRACAESNDSVAWEEFVARFHRPVSLSIVRTAYLWGATPAEVVDDLVQETYLKLCADKCSLLLKFSVEHPGAIGGYIKATATNVAHDHFKALQSQKRGSRETGQLLENTDAAALSTSLGGQDAIEREILLKQVDLCLEKCVKEVDQERDRTIFWLCHQQGMSAKAIAGLPGLGLSAKGVESAISRLTRCVREQLMGLLP